jgi:hypothetical protein
MHASQVVEKVMERDKNPPSKNGYDNSDKFVSVDQLESSIPGLIAQLKGTPTHDHFKVAMIFVDHSSDFTFVHQQRDTSSRETLRATQEFEHIARSYGLRIQQYFMDNGRSINQAWCKESGGLVVSAW